MRLVTLKITGYRQFLKQTTLQFPSGLSGICGPNGVGKSKLIEAIGYALYGPVAAVLPKGDKAPDLPSRAHPEGKADACVELTLEVRGQPYEIVRSRRAASIRLQGATDALAEGSRDVTRKVIELVRLSPAAYYGTFVARQKEVAGLQTLSADERKRLVNRLIGIEQVEHAITLASDERKNRSTRLTTIRETLVRPSAEAIAARATLQAQLETAQAEDRTRTAALKGAQGVYDEEAATVAKLQERRDALKEQRDALSPFQDSHTTLKAMLENAQRRLDEAIVAAQSLNAAQDLLSQTGAAQARVEQLDVLAAIARIYQQQADIQRRLADELAPRAAAREAVQRTLSETDATLATLRSELSAREQARARAEQQRQQTKERRAQLERRLETAQRLGPDGACEACGQTFGDNLESALAHYAAECDTARKDEMQAEQTVTELLQQETAQRTRISVWEQTHAQQSEQLQSYDEVPGELTSTQRELDELDALLAEHTSDELTLARSYDANVHEAMRTTASRRAHAEAEVSRLTALSATDADAHTEMENIERQIQMIEQQQQQIAANLAEDSLLADNLTQAQERLQTAATLREECETKAQTASEQRIRLTTQLEGADQQVGQSLALEARIAEAESALRVAERTEEALKRLLVEITAEARPRLTELVDGWARALLGERFTQIKLTEDYTIRADNGTGLHQITHFSGGEQTLLAVMLRVAIALFCRERAGFDTSFLILDEVFGDQDSDHRAQLVQFLEEVKVYYHQILVINHVEDVTEMLDSIIDVKPNGRNMSTAELRN